jgi:hypothetical protein
MFATTAVWPAAMETVDENDPNIARKSALPLIDPSDCPFHRSLFSILLAVKLPVTLEPPNDCTVGLQRRVWGSRSEDTRMNLSLYDLVATNALLKSRFYFLGIFKSKQNNRRSNMKTQQ